MKRLTAIVAFCLLVAGCDLIPFLKSPDKTPSQEPTNVVTTQPTSSTPTSAPTASAPTLGAWKPSCTTPDSDAAGLIANLAGALSPTGPKPGSAEFNTAVDIAVKPLKECPAAHAMAVQSKIAIASDPAASKAVQGRVSAMIRSMTLTLGGKRVGRFTVDKTGMAEAKPVLIAVLGEPTETKKSSCPLSGYTWTTLSWSDFSIGFRTSSPGSPLDSWEYTSGKGKPSNIEIEGGLHFTATFAELKKIKPSITQEDMFGTGGPYIAVPVPGITYGWDNSRSGPSNWIIGGNLNGCE